MSGTVRFKKCRTQKSNHHSEKALSSRCVTCAECKNSQGIHFGVQMGKESEKGVREGEKGDGDPEEKGEGMGVRPMCSTVYYVHDTA